MLFDRSVFDNVSLPLVISGLSHKDCAGRVRAALDMVVCLIRKKYFLLLCQGGSSNGVGLARAVVNRPALFLPDEPTGNLDPAALQRNNEVISEFQPNWCNCAKCQS